MHEVHELSLSVALHPPHAHAERAPDLGETRLHLGERRPTVELGLAHPEEVEVRSIQDGDPHRCFSPCSQELNWEMSSAVRSAGSAGVTTSCPPVVGLAGLSGGGPLAP